MGMFSSSAAGTPAIHPPGPCDDGQDSPALHPGGRSIVNPANGFSNSRPTNPSLTCTRRQPSGITGSGARALSVASIFAVGDTPGARPGDPAHEAIITDSSINAAIETFRKMCVVVKEKCQGSLFSDCVSRGSVTSSRPTSTRSSSSAASASRCSMRRDSQCARRTRPTSSPRSHATSFRIVDAVSGFSRTRHAIVNLCLARA